jgi:cytochrome c oxidase subunit 2
MTPDLPGSHPLALWPAAASLGAVEVDWLILAFTLVTLLLTVPIFVAITYFALRYRAGRNADRTHSEGRNVKVELSWMLIPFAMTLAFFLWGAKIFNTEQHPPADAMHIEAIGRQWMWKFEHEGGQAEINDLHVPAGKDILVNMISQDVIHSLYLPALRLQMETLPDRYTQLWFKANRPGVYRLYCSEYCGTDHSKMDGNLYVMRPADFAKWLVEDGSTQSLAAVGARLYTAFGCAGCHGAGSRVAPSLAGIYGAEVPLASGGTALADDTWLRRKILNPDSDKLAGYAQVMPSFEGILKEDDLSHIVAYIRTLQEPTQ